MRKIVMVAGLTLVHAALSFAVFLVAFGATSDRFDSGRAASFGERLIDFSVQALYFPLALLAFEQIPAGWLPGLWGYTPILLNSLLWALVLTFVVTRLLHRWA